MAAPSQWNGFLVPTLLDMGIACVLFDTPLAGERSLARNFRGEIVSEVAPLVRRRVRVRPALVPRLMQAVAQDFPVVLGLVRERHGLGDRRMALFGVSLGALLAAYAFCHDGTGGRLLGAVGHADLTRFARSRMPADKRWLVKLPGRVLAQLGGWFYGQGVAAGLQFLAVLHELASGSPAVAAANPMTYADRVGPGRRVRFLVGAEDPVVRPKDAVRCAARFPDGACDVVPGLAHGGDGFVDHVRYFLATQLGDWAW
jgi:predicted esterase